MCKELEKQLSLRIIPFNNYTITTVVLCQKKKTNWLVFVFLPFRHREILVRPRLSKQKKKNELFDKHNTIMTWQPRVHASRSDETACEARCPTQYARYWTSKNELLRKKDLQSLQLLRLFRHAKIDKQRTLKNIKTINHHNSKFKIITCRWRVSTSRQWRSVDDYATASNAHYHASTRSDWHHR